MILVALVAVIWPNWSTGLHYKRRQVLRLPRKDPLQCGSSRLTACAQPSPRATLEGPKTVGVEPQTEGAAGSARLAPPERTNGSIVRVIRASWRAAEARGARCESRACARERSLLPAACCWQHAGQHSARRTAVCTALQTVSGRSAHRGRPQQVLFRPEGGDQSRAGISFTAARDYRRHILGRVFAGRIQAPSGREFPLPSRALSRGNSGGKGAQSAAKSKCLAGDSLQAAEQAHRRSETG